MSILVDNKKIHFDYEVLEQMEAGIELLGHEVKSVRGKNGGLAGAYVTVRGGEAFLINSFIPPYQEKNAPTDYDPQRNRKLLLTKIEIATLGAIESQKGLTVVPISMYNKGRKIKVLIAVVRGKKKFDKRETMKKRESDREISRTLKYK